VTGFVNWGEAQAVVRCNCGSQTGAP
jgi:hypothetical protein